MISYIVSVLDRPHFLNACLASLAVQQFTKEVIVCVNGLGPVTIEDCRMLGMRYGARVMETGNMGALDCYDSANMATGEASGDWLCFPSDDSLYVMDFSRIMLDTARLTASGLVYCDCVYRQEPAKGRWPPYQVLDVRPHQGRIDKTTFILRRDLFHGFPSHPKGHRDGALIEELMRAGVRHAKAPGVLVVHQ